MSSPTKSNRLKPFYAMFSMLIVTAGLLAACASVGQTPAANGAPTKVTGQPRLSVDRTQVDFGKVPMDKMVKATFIVTNIGDKPLQIMGEPTVKVAKGCWPPQAVVGSTTIQPGQQTDLSLQFTMHKGMAGPHEFRVDLKTNDPTEPQKELVVLSDWVE